MSDQGNIESFPFEKDEPKDGKTKAVTTLEQDDSGVFSLKTMSDQLSFAATLMRRGMISTTFKNESSVVIGIQYAKVLGLHPLIALRMMYVIDGKPALYSEGPLALVQRSPQFGKINEFFIDENGDWICVQGKNLKNKVYGAVTRVWRSGDGAADVQEDFFTLDDLARAKINIGKNGKKDVWEKYERIMMRYKARSVALRTKFADSIAGINIAEADFHFSPETPEIKIESSHSVAEELNAAYLQKSEEEGREGAAGGEDGAVPGVREEK